MTASRKIIVGLFVIGGFVLFALGLFWIGDRRLLFSESLELETQFANLSGLKTGSKVMVSGMDAGEVLVIHVPTRPQDKFRVRFRVLSRFQPMLRADSTASIQVEGLVGSKVLQVEAGSETAPAIKAGSLLPSREPIEIGAVIQQGVDMIKKVDSAVDEVEARVLKTIDIVTEVGERAQKVVTNVGDDAEEVFRTGKKIARDVEGIVDGVRAGRGVVGKLLNDEQLAARVGNSVQSMETTASNVSRVSEDVRKLAADIESRNLGEKFQRTSENVERVTAQLKDILAELRPAGGSARRGLLDDVRVTLENAREATSDLAENMEALKRNFFFRGYFNQRGFFDLDSVSLEDYQAGRIAPRRDRQHAWLHAADLFQRDAAGQETLTEEGIRKLGEAIAPFLRHAPNTLFMVEGYTGRGSEAEQFLLSRERARTVRRFLVERFGLKPNYVGAIAMGAVASTAPGGAPFEGVALVFFPEKQK